MRAAESLQSTESLEGCGLGQIIVLTSGKGGTGKTTLCAGIAACLAAEGRRVLCIDGDVGLRNLDLCLGMENQAVVSFADRMDLPADADTGALDRIPEHPEIAGLFLLTAPVSRTAEQLDPDAFRRLLQQARDAFDWVLIDGPAGIGPGFRLAAAYADRALVVALNDPASLRDAARTAQLLSGMHLQQMHLAVNRVSKRFFSRTGTTVDDMIDTISLPLLGLVPEDRHVPLAAAGGRPLTLYTQRGAAAACRRIAWRLEGRHVPLKQLR